ncbi:MAG: EamA family transporter, partial [Prevotellaceae bacterium]|nr:EamA family transporter [Prevotellaceae bacterium]
IWLLKIRPATEVGTHAYVNPLVAVCLGKTLGKENVTPVQFAGLIIILLSVMFINRKKAKTG